MTDHSGCLNCQAGMGEGDAFCRRCGQSAETHRFSPGHILHEFFHAFTHTDKTVFGLITGLLVSPGELVRQYLDGQRKKYFNPFTFLLLVAGFSILIINWTGTFKPNSIPRQSTGSGVQRIPDNQASAAMLERARKVSAFMEKRQNLVMIVAVPFNALIFFLCYRSKNRNYAEHLVANVFFVSFVILFSTIIFYPLLAVFHRPPGMFAVLLIMLLSHVLYYAYAYGQLLELNGWKKRTGVVLVSILAISLWSVLTRFLIGWYIRGF